ncbi:MAG: YneF family protein [Bacilli bacterium]|nr:YneF family protein [Bacilli bacterium]
MNMLHDILLVVVGLIVGFIIGFFVARTVMKKYLEKNPPINEKMIGALMASMGRKPNSKQVKQIMSQMNRVK